MRLEKQTITREIILSSIDQMEIIEEYPEDKYLPSYLLLSHCGYMSFHVLIAADVAGDNIRIVTAYPPDPNKWEDDLKTRRKER